MTSSSDQRLQNKSRVIKDVPVVRQLENTENNDQQRSPKTGGTPAITYDSKMPKF